MTPAVERFAELAKEYVRWAELPHGDAQADVATCLNLLGRIYAAGTELPEVDGDNIQAVPEVPKKDVERAFHRFGSLPFQYYFELYQPVTEAPEDPVTGDLCEDLAEIYSDLRAGLEAYLAGSVGGAAFWWRNSFGFHWGRHATSALRAVHCFETRA